MHQYSETHPLKRIRQGVEGRCENTTRERGRLGSVWRADSCRHGRAPSLARLGEKRPATGFTGPLTDLRSLTCDSVTAALMTIQQFIVCYLCH